MAGEMEIVLNLNEDQLLNAAGKTIFARFKPIVLVNKFYDFRVASYQDPTDEQIKNEFKGFKAVKVDAISESGEKGDALILVKDTKISMNDNIKRSIIVVADKGYRVDCSKYFNIIAKVDNEGYSVSALKEIDTEDAADILDTSGNKFLPPRENRLSIEDKKFIINYDMDYTLVVHTNGSYTEQMVGGKETAPIPSTVKFGHSNENHFMALEAKSGYLGLARNQIDLTCIPAQNIANLVGK